MANNEIVKTIGVIAGVVIVASLLYNIVRESKSAETSVPGVVDKVNVGNRLRIPMMPANRSLNLSNAVAIILYEMWRQIGFSSESPPLCENQKYFS